MGFIYVVQGLDDSQVLNLMFLISPKVAYNNFSELIEMHAGEFVSISVKLGLLQAVHPLFLS